MAKIALLGSSKSSFLAAVLCCGLAQAQSSLSVASKILASANGFLSSLDEGQRSKVLFEFNDAAQRMKWSNLPTTMVPRAGLKMGDLSGPQRKAAMGLLAATLSKRGYEKVLAIVEGDEVLRVASGARGSMFGRDLFYISILGKPSVKDPWMLQFGGHHLALNITMVGLDGILTPSLTAAQPAKYTVDGKTVRPLGAENDKAFALINALDDGQRRQAILNYKVADLVLGPGQDGKTIQPEGIKGSAMKRMGGDCSRTGSGGAHGGDQGECGRNLVRVERTDHQRDARVLSDSGTDSGDRVRAPAAWGRPDDAHPYDLPGSDERLREEVSGALTTVTMRRMGVSVLLALSLIGGAAAHRLDEYLQATLIGVTRDGTDVEIQLTPGVQMLPVLMAVIDQDRDGRISSGEERAYVSLVAREVELRVDGVPAPSVVVDREQLSDPRSHA